MGTIDTDIADIVVLIKNTFRALEVEPSDLVTKDDNILYPKKRDGSIRVSEQELKQVFIHYLIQKKQWHISVETPTRQIYHFPKKELPKVCTDSVSAGQSALVDLSLYKGKTQQDLFAHVEFKSGNPNKYSILKDFLKLYQEQDRDKGGARCGFFVHILESSDEGTWKALQKKYQGIKELELMTSNQTPHVEVLIYSLNDSRNKPLFHSADILVNNQMSVENRLTL